MRKILLIGIFINYSLYSLAQVNLVPNYSLEVYDTCPNNTNQIYYATEWFQPCKTANSTDYFNACDSTMSVGVPYNFSGYQYAKTGVAFAGIIIYAPFPSNNYREYIEIKLSSPLLQNYSYCVEFYASLANYTQNAANSLGCLFTVDTFFTDSLDQKEFFIPHMENIQGVITDTMNWVLISGEFIANGGEQFLTIGNFRNDSNTSVMQVQSTGYYFAYYYIDDVSVTLCDTTAVEELKIEDYRLKIYPNPASGSVTVTAKGGNEIIITDIAGRKIKEYKIASNQLKINIDEYENGIYFLILYSEQRLVATKKLCVAK